MKNGGSAFPVLDTTQAENINSLACVDGGMSLRDYFAGQALVGLLSDSQQLGNCESFARSSYQIADAMLAEREKEEKK